MKNAQAIIENAWEGRDKVTLKTKGEIRKAVNFALGQLDSGKLRVVPATFAVEKLVDAGEIPDNTFRCDRESDGRPFTVTAGWGAFIRWKDPGQPEAVLPTSRVDGRDLEPNSVLCDPYGPRNEFWFATYS